MTDPSLPSPENIKALSIQQPWAWLIVNGHKDVENRSWRTKHRGPFLVHAGKGFDQAGYDYVAAHFPDVALPSPADFERGGLVGAATLVECFEPGSDLSGVCSSPWYFGQYGFSLADAKPMVFVPLKGQLNFFRVQPALP